MNGSRTFSFVQITDLHIGFPSPASGESFAEDLRQIEREVGDRAAFIVATGDLTNIGSEEECRAYLEATRATRLKIYPVVGNHDYIGGPWELKKWDAEWYQKLISPMNHSFEHEGLHFISYDYTNQEPVSKPTGLDFDNLRTTPSRWLLEELSRLPKDQPVVLLVHDQKPSEFFEPLQPFRIVATLSGHWHSSRLYHDGRIAHFNSPSLCFGGIDYSPRAYRLFTWNGESLTCETIPLRRPPTVAAPAASETSSVLWKAPLRGEVHLGSPVVSGGRVFVGLMDENRIQNGAVACWDVGSGRESWRTRLDASVKNTVAACEDRVFAVSVTGEVVALSARDGRREWSYQLGDPSQRWVFSSPTANNGSVFVGQGPHFAALDAITGKAVWVRKDLTASDWISSFVTPASDGARVFIGFFWNAYALHALDVRTGTTLWKFGQEHDDNSEVSPLVLDSRGGLYVTRQNGLTRVDAATGRIEWRFAFGEAWSPSAPCIDGDVVFAASGAGRLFAIDAGTGAEKWRWESGDDLSAMHPYRRTGKTIVSSPRVQVDRVWIGSNDGRLVALDKRTGQLVWSHDFGVPVSNSPAFDGDTMFVATRDGWLRAWRLS